MILIVAHHYVVNSGLMELILQNPTSSTSLFLLLFGSWGKMGINCFVFITGYFMCRSQITLKKFLKLLGEVMFYRIVIGAIFWITGYETFSFQALVKCILPITQVSNDFTSCYLLFFLCIPFLNVLIHHLTEKQHIRLILLSGFIYILFGTLPKFWVTMNYVSWFIVTYFIASYIRLYPKRIFDKTKFWGLMTLGSVLLSAVSVVVCAWIGPKIGRNSPYYFVTDSNTFLAVLTALSAFLFFKNLSIKQNKFINVVASSTFGVLCIHACSDTMRQWLWKDVLNNVGMYDSPWIVLHALASVLGVFIVCTLIDQVRIHTIEKWFMQAYDRCFVKYAPRFQAWEERMLSKYHIK